MPEGLQADNEGALYGGGMIVQVVGWGSVWRWVFVGKRSFVVIETGESCGCESRYLLSCGYQN